MSIAKLQLKRFLLEAKRFLLRRGRVIPTEGRIFAHAAKSMKNVKLGAPTFNATQQFQYRHSNVNDYNENVQNAMFDINTFLCEATNQSMRLLRNFNATFVELQRISNQVSNLMQAIDAAKYYQDGYKYIVGDSFRSLDFVDSSRSTVMPDLSTGKISLQTGITEYVDLGFLSLTANPINLHFSRSILKTITTPGSIFGNIFDGSSSYWMIQAFLHEGGELSMSVDIPLSKDGSLQKISGMCIDSVMNGVCTLEYRDNDVWRTIIFDNLEHTNTFSFSTITTDTVRITIKKDSYDKIINGQYVYDFIFRSVAVFLSTSKMAGEFYSKSRRLGVGTSKDAAAMAVNLEVDDNIKPETSIEYFVAVDPYVSGTLYPIGEYTIDGVDPYLYGDDGLAWSNDASGGYVLSSTLRDFSTLSGLTEWSTWTPNWHQFVLNADGEYESVYLDFANFIEPNETLNGFPEIATSFGKWGNIKFIKIFEFVDTYDSTKRAIPSNVKLHPGKNCFLFSENYLKYKDDIIGQGTFADGRMIIYGTEQAQVVHGSVHSIRPWGSDPSKDSSLFTEPDDYIVNYGVPDRWSAEVVQNAGRINVLGGDFLSVQYAYSYRRIEPYYIMETSFYYDQNISRSSVLSSAIDPIIKIYWWVHEGFGRMSEITLTNYDEDGIVRGRYTETQRSADELVKIDIRTVGTGSGWFTLKIKLDIPKEIKLVCKTIEDGPNVGMHALKVVESAGVSVEGTTLSFIQSIFVSLNPMKRIILPEYLTIFAWRKPATQVSEDYLKYRTHKFDHSKFAIIKQSNGYYAVLSNNVAQFAGNSRLIYHGEAIDSVNGILGMDVSEFYDISYITCAGKFDSLLFKAVLKGNGAAAPELKSYTLRVAG